MSWGTIAFVAGPLVAGWIAESRVWNGRARDPAPHPMPPPEPVPVIPSDRGWKEQIYAPAPTRAPDPSAVLFQSLLRAAAQRPRSGVAYEEWLRQRFTAAGWHVALTPRSGDYGADLVGTDPPGRRWVIQAKAWAKPVGVHAVQEVVGAQGYYGATHAAVVSTHGFTPQATILARRTGVQLLTILDG